MANALDELRKLKNTPVRLAPTDGVLRAIKDEETDRGAAIVAGVMVEQGLVLALRWVDRVPQDEEPKWITKGTFDTKIEMARSRRIIDDKQGDRLHIIREIRNTFAHCGVEVNFQTEQVKNVCLQLLPNVPEYLGDQTGAPPPPAADDPRGLYVHNCNAMLHNVVLMGMYLYLEMDRDFGMP